MSKWILALLGATMAHSAYAKECSEGQRLFSHPHLEGESICIPEKPERIAFTMDKIISAYVLGSESVIDNWYLESFRETYPKAINDSQLKDMVYISYYPRSDPEVIASAKPDMIVTEADIGVNKKVSHLAPTVVFRWNEGQSWRHGHEFVGSLLGKEAEAKRSLAELDQRLARLKTDLGDKKPTFAVARVGEEQGSVQVWTELNFGSQILMSAGLKMGDDILGPKDSKALSNAWWYPLSSERLQDLDVDYLFLLKSWAPEFEKKMLTSPLWKTLNVVKEDRVIFAASAGQHYIRENVPYAHLIIDEVYRGVLGKEPSELGNPNPYAKWLEQ